MSIYWPWPLAANKRIWFRKIFTVPASYNIYFSVQVALLLSNYYLQVIIHRYH